jgi:hypothetical protein
MTDTTTAAPYRIHTTDDGTPQEALWVPRDTEDARKNGFQTWYGTTIAALGAEDEIHTHLIALGHDVTPRRLLAAANRWMRQLEGWTNLLDDPQRGAGNFLPRLDRIHVVLLRANDRAGEWEGEWRMVAVDPQVPGAIPVTSLDLQPALDHPERLHEQVEHLKTLLARTVSRVAAWNAPDRPVVVCLCGSTRFMEQMTEANVRITAAGAVVLAPGCDMRPKRSRRSWTCCTARRSPWPTKSSWSVMTPATTAAPPGLRSPSRTSSASRSASCA